MKNNPTLPKAGFINLLCGAVIYTETLEQYNKFRRTFKAEAYKECIEKVKPIIDEIVDIMFDDNKSNCVIHDCVKPSKIACNSEICILENKQAWEGRFDNLLNELVGDNAHIDKQN